MHPQHKIIVGDVEVTVLPDGVINVPLAVFPEADTERAANLARRARVQNNPIATAINAYLVKTESRLYLIDGGSGSTMGATLGYVRESLAAAGYVPADVDAILVTHLHIDHSGGLIENNVALYPNAELFIQEEEAAFWLAIAFLPDPPMRATKRSLPVAISALRAYEAKTIRFPAGAKIHDEIEAYPLPGHTPGHTGYLIRNRGERLLIWGDIVHAPHLQIPMPKWHHDADIDPALATTTRLTILKKAAAEKLLIGGAHISFPGFGWIVEDAETYSFLPLSTGGLQ